MFKEHMPEPEVLAMLSNSQEFEQVKVSTLTKLIGGSVAEWSARRTRNPAVPGSSPALATS